MGFVILIYVSRESLVLFEINRFSVINFFIKMFHVNPLVISLVDLLIYIYYTAFYV